MSCPCAGALIRHLGDGTSRTDLSPGRRDKHLKATDGERKAHLDIFRPWIGDWSLEPWNDISKDELELIKAKD